MSIVTGKTLEPIVLDWENTDGRVRIVPPDNDVMAMSVETAIEACRAFKQQIVFKNQFDQLLNVLAKWLSEHRATVSDAYLTVRDGGLLFLVVQNGKPYDGKLDDALTELDLAIANDDDFSLISLAVHSIPASSEATIQSFVAKKLQLRYRLDAK